MALVTCDGKTVLRGRISLVLRGAWRASLLLEGETVPSGSVTTAAQDGLEIVGTVIPELSNIDRRGAVHASIIGGGGKLKAEVSGSFRSAQLRDPLNAAIKVSGDQLSSNMSQAVLSKSLSYWTQGKHSIAAEYQALARAAGDGCNWRYEADGKLWIGEETWPAAQLPADATIIDSDPSLGMWTIAVVTPTLLPGVNLEGVGKIDAVDHWIGPDGVRSVAWVA